MIPKFRYWNSFLQKMMKVTIIDLKNGILNATILGDEIYRIWDTCIKSQSLGRKTVASWPGSACQSVTLTPTRGCPTRS